MQEAVSARVVVVRVGRSIVRHRTVGNGWARPEEGNKKIPVQGRDFGMDRTVLSVACATAQGDKCASEDAEVACPLSAWMR